uniref:Exocyst subunit Exo70 family protein n=1 Tax=Kalanchoe fedtschenkoi TaxID=63787 RepID=A0A7N0RH75_KALFE
MPEKGMRSLLFTFKSKQPSWPSPPSGDASSPSHSLASTPRRNTQSMIERSIAVADLMVTKWNPDTSGYAQVTSLFHESQKEAAEFIKCVFNLQKSMHLIGHDDPNNNLVRAQNLMQIAMKRLQKEFYQILSTNRARLDSESVSVRSSRTSSTSSISDCEDGATTEDDIIKSAAESISEFEQASIMAMDNLRSLAECMIACGYGRDCIKIYTIIRKSVIDEGLYKLGVEKISQTYMNKLTWDSQDLKIQRWLHATEIALKTLFAAERFLCDHVFEASGAVRESCFAEISRDGANLLFSFPEIVAKTKKSPEKMIRVLNMYAAIVANWSEIEAIFSSDSSSHVRTQALNSLPKLGEAARSMLSEFEAAVQRDSTKAAAAGGGVDPLTIYVMNTLSCLSDYSAVLNEILANHPPPDRSRFPDSYFDYSSPGEAPAPAISVHVAWLILFLLCKLDERSKLYRDVSTSYLFLANNLQHVVSEVRRSNLKYVLGESWIRKQEEKTKQFVGSYESAAWGGVHDSLPDDTAAISAREATQRFKKFSVRFGEAYRKESACVVADQKLRDEIKECVAGKLVPRYREFYRMNRSRVVGGGGGGGVREGSLSLAVRFTPDDVANYLSDLYFDDGGSESGALSLSFPSPSPSPSLSR